MNSNTLWGATCALGLLCTSAGSQQYSHDISLAGLGNGNASKPFGISYEPASDRIYVAVAGTFSTNNSVVAVIDPSTDSIVGTIETELFPEEIAFAYDANGNLACGAVSNSSSGSLTIFDASNTLLGHVALPDPFGLGSCFPFGLVFDPSSQRFFVSTLDGSGDIHAVDPATLSVDATASLVVPFSSGSRLALSQGKLIVGAGRFNASFSNGDAGFAVVDIASGVVEENLLVDETRGFYPGVQEVEVLADGRVVMGLLGMNEHALYFADSTGELQRAARVTGVATTHGIGVHANGELLALCDLGGDRVLLWDMLNMTELGTISLRSVGLGYGLPNDAIFVGDKLYVTSQATEEIVVFDQLPHPVPGPAYAGSITVSDSTPTPGDTITVTVSGPGLVALAFARSGDGELFRGIDLEIGPGATLRGTAVGTLVDSFSFNANPALRGLTIWLQGAVNVDSVAKVTEPRVLVLQ